uniref:Chemokine (C-X-C motif) ligand 8b, duplicate 3 n=1 Tax=Cyprinus carpio TaxID=7962 RepID=A0A8C1MTN8_CYPCA
MFFFYIFDEYFMLILQELSLSLTADISARPPIQQLRCQCVKTYSGKPINPKLIQKVQMISAGPQCRNVEIIATLKNGLTCLNPTDEWVKNILEFRSFLAIFCNSHFSSAYVCRAVRCRHCIIPIANCLNADDLLTKHILTKQI